MKTRYRILYDKTNIGEKYYVVQRRRRFIWYSLGYDDSGELTIWVRKQSFDLNKTLEKRFSKYDCAIETLKTVITTDGYMDAKSEIVFEMTDKEK